MRRVLKRIVGQGLQRVVETESYRPQARILIASQTIPDTLQVSAEGEPLGGIPPRVGLPDVGILHRARLVAHAFQVGVGQAGRPPGQSEQVAETPAALLKCLVFRNCA